MAALWDYLKVFISITLCLNWLNFNFWDKMFQFVGLHFYRASPKLMLSAANDGNIIAWSTGGTVYDKIPVCMEY